MAGSWIMRPRRALLPSGVATLLLLAAGCAEADAGHALREVSNGPAGSSGAVPAPGPEARQPVWVDSLFPPDEELRRFREGLEEPAGLRGGAGSRVALVDALIRGLEAADTVTITALAIDRAEFAWFHFPHSIYTAPPYELPPGLVWFQSQNRSSRGLDRLLRNYAGKPLFYTGHQCPDDGEPWGGGRIWHGCTVLGELPSGEAVEERLFGSVLEVQGRFKFVSFSNKL